MKRIAFALCAFVLAGSASPASANSCSNVSILGTNDYGGLHENPVNGGVWALGTFRISGEADEDKQPKFNFAMVDCEPDANRGTKCKLDEAIMWASSGKPDTDNPNCQLDLQVSTYSMKELERGVLTGMDDNIFNSTGCFNTILTIDRNATRVYLSFTKTKYNKAGTCGSELPRTQVMMNCTPYPRLRKEEKGGQTPPRYCDFSSAFDQRPRTSAPPTSPSPPPASKSDRLNLR